MRIRHQLTAAAGIPSLVMEGAACRVAHQTPSEPSNNGLECNRTRILLPVTQEEPETILTNESTNQGFDHLEQGDLYAA